MKSLVLMAVLLLASVAEFVLVGRPALEGERRALADLLTREASVQAMESRLPPALSEELGALLADRDRVAQLARLRLALVKGGDEPTSLPSLDELLEARNDRVLATDSRLGISVRAQAGLSPEAHDAMTLLLDVLGDCRGLEALELADDGKLVPVANVPGLQQLQASLVVSASITEVLGVLERLVPSSTGGLPLAGVMSASLRRIEPEHWGSGLHLLDTPPVRLAVTVAIVFPADVEGGA